MMPMSLDRLLAVVGLVTAAALPLPAAAFSNLFVFGDSLSDTGNNALLLGVDADQVIDGNTYIPTYPYASRRYSNDEVWTVDFARSIGLTARASLAGGNIYANGGARTSGLSPDGAPSIRGQVRRFLHRNDGVADSDALYVVGLGGNNARDTLEAIEGGADLAPSVRKGARRYARGVGDMVDRLQAAGAERIIVWNTPDLAVAPAVAAAGPAATFLAGVVVDAMNQALSARLADEAGVTLFDTYALFGKVVARPADYGLVNVTDACGALPTCEPSNYLFWDGIHPTSAGHAILSQAMQQAAVVPEPGTAWLFALGLGGLTAWRFRRA